MIDGDTRKRLLPAQQMAREGVDYPAMSENRRTTKKKGMLRPAPIKEGFNQGITYTEIAAIY
ncbi:hypothetical protein ASG44_08770 [Methylophilus sp. Leaf459]|nr:hypothetical protein ASG34_12910 [Methylophilus sp. Leaf416]KQT55562.1 hypothetical protein ASG44_08770 [Methylophilus sp. Leaf459]